MMYVHNIIKIELIKCIYYYIINIDTIKICKVITYLQVEFTCTLQVPIVM